MTDVKSRARTPLRRLAYIGRRALQLEIGIWLSLYRFVFRRPRVPRGATAFTYHRPVHQILIVFIVLSAVEIVVLDLIVHQWLFIRIPVLILGIWGLTWMLGYLFGFLTRPHAVGPDGIAVRFGAEVDVRLGWDDIHSVALNKVVAEPKTPQVTEEAGVATLHLRMQNETNIEVELERPREVHLPRGRETVSRVHFHVDDPKQFMDAVREHLAPA